MKVNSGKRPITFFFFFAFLSVVGIVFAQELAVDKPESTIERQLRINKNALLQGPGDQNRVDAAMALLLHESESARKILIETLAIDDNPPAIRAICNSLISCKKNNEPVEGMDDFMNPLVSLLLRLESKDADLVAEVLLAYDFSQIEKQLFDIAISSESAKQAKLNVISVMKLRLQDKDVLIKLVELLDNDDKDVVDAVAVALPYWIPKGVDPETILYDLKRKSQAEITRDRMLYLDDELRKVLAERDQWIELFIKSLDKSYESGDDVGKGKVLFESLGENQPSVIKLWAIDKVSVRPGSVVLPDGFAERLLKLVSNGNKQVRLATAKVLARMSKLHPAESLLAQLKVETYDDVRLTIFEALGEACYFALLSSGTEPKLPAEVRSQTLAEAVKYLNDDDYEKSKSGAVVIRKLIEPNGMDKQAASGYIENILIRYNSAEPDLKADLLNVMAKISGQTANRQAATLLYQDAFVKGLEGANGENLLKQAAVVGLTNIDKAAALTHFTQRRLYDDSNTAVRSMVIKLAGEVGNVGDLDWLATKVDVNGTGNIAWQSTRDVLKRQDAVVIVDWADKLIKRKSSPEYIRELLEIAEQKAAGQEDSQTVLTRLYDVLTPELLRVYLGSNNLSNTVQLVSVRLKRLGDIDVEDKVVAAISGYLNAAETNANSKKVLLEALAAIKPYSQPESTSKLWLGVLKTWQDSIAPKPVEVKKPEPAPTPVTEVKEEPKTETVTK